MRAPRMLYLIPAFCLASVFFLSHGDLYAQETNSQADSAAALPESFKSDACISVDIANLPTTSLHLFRTDSVTTLRQTAEAGPHSFDWSAPGLGVTSVSEQASSTAGGQSQSGRKVRKAPLVLGIVGAAVMGVGIAMATDSCGIGPCFHSAGVATAVVGGGMAVAGFYFAFKR